MSLTDDFNRRLDFAKREMEEVGLDEEGPLYDALRGIGIPVPPLSYSSFLLNFIVLAFFWTAMIVVFGVIFGLVASRSLEVLTAASAILASHETWIGAMLTGMAGGAISVYRRRKYKLTTWNAI